MIPWHDMNVDRLGRELAPSFRRIQATHLRRFFTSSKHRDMTWVNRWIVAMRNPDARSKHTQVSLQKRKRVIHVNIRASQISLNKVVDYVLQLIVRVQLFEGLRERS